MNVGSATLRDASYPLRRALLLPHAAVAARDQNLPPALQLLPLLPRRRRPPRRPVLCYKRLVQDAVITPELRTLVFGNADDPRDVNVVEYDAAHDVLTLGCYGRFVPEDTSRTREEPHIVEADPADETE